MIRLFIYRIHVIEVINFRICMFTPLRNSHTYWVFLNLKLGLIFQSPIDKKEKLTQIIVFFLAACRFLFLTKIREYF